MDKLEKIALQNNCIDYDDVLNYLDDDEAINLIKDIAKCIYGGNYFDKENTEFIIRQDYIEIYVNEKFEGKYQMIFDRGLGVNRLYSYN